MFRGVVMLLPYLGDSKIRKGFLKLKDLKAFPIILLNHSPIKIKRILHYINFYIKRKQIFNVTHIFLMKFGS